MRIFNLLLISRFLFAPPRCRRAVAAAVEHAKTLILVNFTLILCGLMVVESLI